MLADAHISSLGYLWLYLVFLLQVGVSLVPTSAKYHSIDI